MPPGLTSWSRDTEESQDSFPPHFCLAFKKMLTPERKINNVHFYSSDICPPESIIFIKRRIILVELLVIIQFSAQTSDFILEGFATHLPYFR